MSSRFPTRRAMLAGTVLAGVAGSVSLARAAGFDNFKPVDPPRPAPDLAFSDEAGNPLTLADFRGKVVLFNAWATWCVPCVLEMPSLARLQASFLSAGLRVLPVSTERNAASKIRTFYEQNRISGLPVLLDRNLSISRKLHPRGLPLSLLVDRAGNEVARLLGGANWDSAELHEKIGSFL